MSRRRSRSFSSIGVVLVGLAARVALERPQPVRAAGVGVRQRLGTGSRPRQGGDVAVRVVLERLAVAAVLRRGARLVGVCDGELVRFIDTERIKGISAKSGWADPIRPAAKLAHKDPLHTLSDADGCAPTAEIDVPPKSWT